MTIQMKATEQFFHVELYKVVLTLKSVNETFVCDHSNRSYSQFSSTFMRYCLLCRVLFIMLYKVVLRPSKKKTNNNNNKCFSFGIL